MLLETKDLTKIYRRGEKEFRAVDKASISVEKGELAVITGPSGCGKSTLFHLISGSQCLTAAWSCLREMRSPESLRRRLQGCGQRRSAIFYRETACWPI